MTFEKALEAMKQGKKITYEGSEFYYFMSGENEIRCINFVIGYETTVKFFCSNILSDKWEIYEEPQKEPEMTDEKACKILDLILDYINVGEFEYITHCSFSEIAESVRMAIEALENQNQTKLFFDVGNISEKEFEELQRKLKECKLEVNPEKKCECECKCNHTVVDDDMQELMKQALVRKFFELEKEDFLHNETQAAIYTMFEIYKILYP